MESQIISNLGKSYLISLRFLYFSTIWFECLLVCHDSLDSLESLDSLFSVYCFQRFWIFSQLAESITNS